MAELKIKYLKLRIYQIDSTDFIYILYIYIIYIHISEDKFDRLLEKYNLSKITKRRHRKSE